MKGSTLLIAQVSEFSANNVFYNGQGANCTILAGTIGNLDLKMLDDNFLTGGQLNVKFGTWGDTVNMQVVDVDGIMAPPGYVIRQFATNVQIMDGSQKQETFNLTYPAKVLCGLYLRVNYNSIGTTNPLVQCNYDLHRALY